MNEIERATLNEILRTVTYIAEKLDKLEEQLSPHLSETDKKEVMFLIRDALSNNKGIVDSNLNNIEVSPSVDRGEEGVK
ncbi:hypothetical protein V2V72_07820 [Streptococcus agalactiae]